MHSGWLGKKCLLAESSIFCQFDSACHRFSLIGKLKSTKNMLYSPFSWGAFFVDGLQLTFVLYSIRFFVILSCKMALCVFACG